MTDFKFTEKVENNVLHLKMEGIIDEEVKFPTVNVGQFAEVRIDLESIKSINSVGIREWLSWIRPIAEKSKVVFIKASKPLVFQMNMVEGFLPKNAVVESFFVPFYCEKCDKEENILFQYGKEVQKSGTGYKVNFDVKQAKLCSDAACEMEMDATEAKYFQFLKSQP